MQSGDQGGRASDSDDAPNRSGSVVFVATRGETDRYQRPRIKSGGIQLTRKRQAVSRAALEPTTNPDIIAPTPPLRAVNSKRTDSQNSSPTKTLVNNPG